MSSPPSLISTRRGEGVHERLERKMDELKEAGIFFAEYTPVRAEGDVSATVEVTAPPA